MPLTFTDQDPEVNGNGAMVTVGLQIADQPVAMVFPMVKTAGTIDINKQCLAAAAAMENWMTAGPGLMSFLAADVYMSYIESTGMIDGMIPARAEYAPTDFPGGVTGACVPQQVSALMTAYQDQGGVYDGRLKRAHQYIPGLPQAKWTADSLDSTVQAGLLTLFTGIIDAGITDGTSGTVWKRYLAQPYTIVSGHKTRPPGTQVPRIKAYDIREYPATQRRRLLPRY